MTKKVITISRAFGSGGRTIGKEVAVHRFDTVRHGHAVDVDDDGGLLVEFPDGRTETVSSGEASVRGMYGYV